MSDMFIFQGEPEEYEKFEQSVLDHFRDETILVEPADKVIVDDEYERQQ